MAGTFTLPLIDRTPPPIEVPDGVLPLSLGKRCGTGCDPGHGAHSPSAVRSRQEEPALQVPFAQRRLNLDAVPDRGTPVSNLDMDLTVECNLRCTYCFKEKWNEHMEEQIAFDTMVWFLHASGDVKDLHVSFMGGEPLLRFKLIKKLVPFAKRRAAQHGKTINFGMTTNGTLVTDEVVDFWTKWNLGFHTSIDGVPEVQDANRPTTGGKGSSRLVEASSKRILAAAPNTTARSTVVADSAHQMVDSYHYFRSLGYQDIAFVPGALTGWTEESLSIYESQYRQVAERVISDLRKGHPILLKGIDDYADSTKRTHRENHACGAGRGMALVDIHGDLWPCHRWNKEGEQSWRIGSIYEQFDEAARSQLDVPSFSALLENECHRCPARLACSGGCPAENLEDTGSVYRRHHNACAITRIWHKVGQYVHDTMMAEDNQAYQDTYCREGHDVRPPD